MALEENLLIETIRVLDDNDKTPSDVWWVGSVDGAFFCGWDKFKELANFSYNARHGSAVIPEDLVIVGEDWWLTRGEYDGSEWWDFHTKPRLKENPFQLETLKGETLSEAHDHKNRAW